MSANVFFTSDVHLGHFTAANHRQPQLLERGDPNSDKMVAAHDAEVLDSIYALPKGAQLWVLGDLSRGGADERNALQELGRAFRDRNIEAHLITGNHDSCSPVHRNSHKSIGKFTAVFRSVQAYAKRRMDGEEILLSHFPYDGDSELKDEGQLLTVAEASMACRAPLMEVYDLMPILLDHGATRDADGTWQIPISALKAATLIPQKANRYEDFRLQDKGKTMLHGHTHHKRKLSRTHKGTLQVHVGFDAWRRPASYEEIDEILRAVKTPLEGAI